MGALTIPIRKRRHTMSLYKRGNIYWCVWEIGGKRIRETTGTTSQASAQEYHDRRRAEIWRTSKLGDVAIETWDAAVLQWVTEHAKHKRSYETDRLRLVWLTEKLTGKQIDTITTDLMIALRKELLQSRAPATANRFLAVISAVLSYAHTKGKLTGVPKIPYLKEDAGRFLWLTQEQANALVMELPDHLSLMARLALATGLRRANITDLEWKDVDMTRKVCWIWAESAKGGKNISVPLNDDAIAILEESKKINPFGYVFTYKGKPITRTTTAAWYKATKRAGIDPEFSFHGLRHTWASWHVMSGTPLSVLQTLGAWSSMAMVQKYAHLAPDFVAQYANNSMRVTAESTTAKNQVSNH